jgi:thioredoxin-dependent peroxiredoxin
MASLLGLLGCGSGALKEGSSAPALRGVAQDRQPVDLAAERGRFVVVYFYPKDQTPGCTKEACAFRDVWSRYQAANVQVIGVSNNDVESHEGFAKAHALPFPLVADTDGSWATAFGVPSLAGFYKRITFVVTPRGQVGKVYEDVDPGVHALQVLQDIQHLASAEPGAPAKPVL